MRCEVSLPANSANPTPAVHAAKAPMVLARVTVYPRRDILDPQGKAIQQALARLGFAGVQSVRAGKSFEIALAAVDPQAAAALVQEMSERFLTNPVVEDFTVEILAEDSV